jgi:predicted alpha-1,2-mannosidase
MYCALSRTASRFSTGEAAARRRQSACLRFLGCSSIAAATLLRAALAFPAQEPFREVDPLAGTANDGQTVPLIGMPFAMTQWVPETRSTEDKCVAPYYYNDKQITGFRGSHWLDGSCAKEYGSFTLMPITGPITVAPAARASTFRHETEKINPAYYAVTLDRYAERVEMTGSVRSGFLRITFPPGAEGTILLEPNAKPGDGFVEIHPEAREIVGYNPVRRYYVGTALPANFSSYFVARFSAPFKAQGTWCDQQLEPDNRLRAGGCRRLGAYASFAPAEGPLLVKIGTSFTSLDEAARNLDAEQKGWDFAALEQTTEAAWKALLGQIEVEGGTPDQRKIFYTALYHASLVPRIASDADGTYNGFAGEGQPHNLKRGDYYDDYSLWDTFRALHPLLTITEPEREQEMVESLVLKGEQGGYLPIFPLFNSYTSAMVGDHAGAVIADAYAKGLTHFEVDQAYRLMLQNATTSPSINEYELGLGRRALASYLHYGYIPLEDPVSDAFHYGEQVSRTLEYAYDDSLVAMMAGHLGKREDAQRMQKQSENWRNVFDPSAGFVRGRHADGSWIEPFDAKKNINYVTEANPWQYTFFVPQNIPGLIKAMGGDEKFIAKLDGLFDGNVYDQGNEPSHHIAYLYDYAGARAKTQHQVRRLLASQYHVGVGGLPGNDDAGQMSAWYIFSAMGFYPVAPGTASYAIGTPLFSRVTIHQPNGKTFVIEASHQSAANEYIQTQQLNGKPMEGFLLPHAEIVKGGTLSFDMGPEAPERKNGH